jgi:hypothetical protein
MTWIRRRFEGKEMMYVEQSTNTRICDNLRIMLISYLDEVACSKIRAYAGAGRLDELGSDGEAALEREPCDLHMWLPWSQG